MPINATIFADGDPCSTSLRNYLRKGRFTILLDGAAEKARKDRWTPQLIAGDFDTVSKSTLKHFEKKGVEILHAPDQNYTDLEKAIAWCVLHDMKSIWIAQAIGERLDHSFAALSFLKRFHSPEREVVLFRDHEKVRFARNEKLILDGKTGRALAVLPFPKCLVKSSGLAYEMRGIGLEIGVRESVSNRSLRRRAKIEIEGEALISEGI